MTLSMQYTSSASGSDGDLKFAVIDEKKRKRMISNRESARRSRMRKQKHVESLASEKGRLEMSNKMAIEKINNETANFLKEQTEKRALESEKQRLVKRLEFLQHRAKVLNVELPEIRKPHLNPWELPYPSQNPIRIQSPVSNQSQLPYACPNQARARNPVPNPSQFSYGCQDTHKIQSSVPNPYPTQNMPHVVDNTTYPWQLPYWSQPITASTGLFNF